MVVHLPFNRPAEHNYVTVIAFVSILNDNTDNDYCSLRTGNSALVVAVSCESLFSHINNNDIVYYDSSFKPQCFVGNFEVFNWLNQEFMVLKIPSYMALLFLESMVTLVFYL